MQTEAQHQRERKQMEERVSLRSAFRTKGESFLVFFGGDWGSPEWPNRTKRRDYS